MSDFPLEDKTLWLVYEYGIVIMKYWRINKHTDLVSFTSAF
jgi:hypothetical protein